MNNRLTPDDSLIPPDLITAKEAAKALRVNLATIYRWLLSGKLKGWKRAGTRYLVALADVKALLQPVAPQRPGYELPATSRQYHQGQEQAKARLREAGFKI